MSNTAYFAIVITFAAGLMLCAKFLSPGYGDMLAEDVYTSKQQPRWPRGCWKVDDTTTACD